MNIEVIFDNNEIKFNIKSAFDLYDLSNENLKILEPYFGYLKETCISILLDRKEYYEL